MNYKEENIYAFTSVRFFWAITVLVCHIYAKYNEAFDDLIPDILLQGEFAVTHFFVLSVFLVCMHYGDSYAEMLGINEGKVFC